jgi:hypothetical protein
MTIAGVSIILLLGILNFILLLFQLSSGMRWIKASFAVHRRTGVLLLVSAVLHATLALLAD